MARLLSTGGALFRVCLIFVSVTMTASIEAQTFSVIHSFGGRGIDGYAPVAGVTLGPGGKLYGTTTESPGDGTVFELKPVSGNWIVSLLLQFTGTNGANPAGGVVFGPDGALYGTTFAGGSGLECYGGAGCGIVYSLRPPANPCHSVSCPWTQTILYSFNGQPNAEEPYMVNPVFDAAGNIYGTTYYGGVGQMGTVFQLTRSNGEWTENLIQSFTGQNGGSPSSGLILDSAGNLYGTTPRGGETANGTVFELSPSGSGWTETVLYDFPNRDVNGCVPVGPVIFDASGNLYGTTETCGSTNNGTVFELSPSGGGWTYTVLYSFGYGVIGGDGGPEGNLAMDAAGNLYGTTYSSGAYGCGSVWKLTRSGSGWTYTDLHDFTGGSDGANPIGGPVLDADGNVYGTTWMGGSQGVGCFSCGVVWEISQ